MSLDAGERIAPVGVSVEALPKRALVAAYGATMLLSACLLFLIQPMFARMALPLLGGTPAVWAIAMCFFQAVLLGGYAYAHALRRFANPGAAVMIHAALLCFAFILLPVAPPPTDVPPGGASLGVWLIATFAKSIGIPFFALSATAPLLQSWFARTRHPDASNPYFLYSASNIGSIGALLVYPFLIEPLFGLKSQSAAWSAGFAALIAGMAVCGYLTVRWAAAPSAETEEAAAPIAMRTRAYWVFMAFIPSAFLVAFTNHVTTDITSAPFLWLPPLVLFLLTFVLVFRDPPLISMKLARIVQLVAFPIAYGLQFALFFGPMLAVMTVGALGFFATALICHRQLYESRPPAQRLTEFYMLMSLGGVLGGLFVSILAPLLFNSIVEYSLLMILGIAARADLWGNPKLRELAVRPYVPVAVFAALWGLLTVTVAASSGPHASPAELALFGTFAAVLIMAKRWGLAVLAVFMMPFINATAQPEKRLELRSYFGIMSVTDSADGAYRFLLHGTTTHGAEKLAETAATYAGRPHPMTYYSSNGGMTRTVTARQQVLQEQGKTGAYAIIGLGTGSIACFKKPEESWTFYEIDPDVIRVARDPAQFTYLSSCAPGMPIVEGDARLTLGKTTDGALDYLLVDAFSSDSIPAHLLTTEAVRSYLSKLRPDGTLAFHLTNRFMDLVPYVTATVAAADPSLQGRLIDFYPAKPDLAEAHSTVIVFSRDAKVLETLDKGGGTAPVKIEAGLAPWTDDFANVPAAIWRRLSASR